MYFFKGDIHKTLTSLILEENQIDLNNPYMLRIKKNQIKQINVISQM